MRGAAKMAAFPVRWSRRSATLPGKGGARRPAEPRTAMERCPVRSHAGGGGTPPLPAARSASGPYQFANLHDSRMRPHTRDFIVRFTNGEYFGIILSFHHTVFLS